MKTIFTYDEKSYEVSDEMGEKIRLGMNDKHIPGFWFGKEYEARGNIRSITGDDTVDLSRFALPGIVNEEQNIINEIAPKYEWACSLFKFSPVDMAKLISLSYRKFKKMTIDEFEEFLIKTHAVDEFHRITTGKYTDKKGQPKRAAFAYPFFMDIWREVKKKKDIIKNAEDKSWDQILKIQG